MHIGHGDDIFLRQNGIVANFSSNVWAGGNYSQLKEVLCNSIDLVKNYPEPYARPLRKLLASKFSIDEGSILITNGAAEAIYLLAHFFKGQNSLIPCPTFSEYEGAARINDHSCTFCDRAELEIELNKEINTVWLCSPNNPDGYVWGKDRIIDLVKSNKNKYFIIDESFCDFCLDYNSYDHFLNDHKNLIIIRSFTKKFGIPGVRLGYLLGAKELIEQISEVQQPWSVNNIAISMGQYIIENEALLNFPIEELMEESTYLQEQISLLTGYEVFPSSTPFFLVKILRSTSPALKKYLLDRGMLVRDASNFRGLDDHYIRICPQDRPANSLLIDAMVEFWKQS